MEPTTVASRIVRSQPTSTCNPGEEQMAQVIGVPREVFPGEKRVATVPEVVPKLAKLGFSVIVQSGAGAAASISDEAYAAAGATVVPDAAAVWSGSDIVFKVRAPSPE